MTVTSQVATTCTVVVELEEDELLELVEGVVLVEEDELEVLVDVIVAVVVLVLVLVCDVVVMTVVVVTEVVDWLLGMDELKVRVLDGELELEVDDVRPELLDEEEVVFDVEAVLPGPGRAK